ncbi:glutathione S-transferase family protein [Pseudomonas sp. SCB32]|uniref:glutathione S-transferase family protein n=1 Tax=Pseudomonas sp. SCB32 TaxID=2653853 RepID=UPI0012646780|nr:glutathione S-transferase [Pseudomonas sp. SCB32]
MLRILGRASSINVRKVLWTCAELNLPYEREDWGTGFRSTASAEFIALNPNAMVPVLVDGDFVLWESNAICGYLAGQYPRNDLMPTASRERARVEQWMGWQATELNNAWRYAFTARVRNSPSHTDESAIALSEAQWNHCMSILDQQLQNTGAYVAGECFTLADIVIGLSVNRWYLTPMQRPDLPAVTAYYERLSERSGFLLHGRNGEP